MRKIVTTLLCFALAMSLLLCGCLFEDPAKKHAVETQIVTDEQGQTIAVVAGSTQGEALYNDDLSQLNLLQQGLFYFVGSITDETGSMTRMEFACKDGNTYMGASMDGVDIGFMHLGEDNYMVYPEGKCALLLDNAIYSMMDMDPDEMNIDMSALSFGDLENAQLIETTEALVDSTIATCRTYLQTSGNYVKTYVSLSDGKLIRMQQITADGIVSSTIDIQTLTDLVPAEKVSLVSGYKLYKGILELLPFALNLPFDMGSDSLA